MNDKIEHMLKAGKTKKQIWQALKGEANSAALAQELNNASRPVLRRQYMYINLLLTAALMFLTFNKISAALTFGFNLSMLLFMIVPLINMFLLQKILKFKRNGYQLLLLLSCLSLIHSENHNVNSLSLLAVIIGLSALLYIKLFPKNESIKIPS